MDQSALAGWHDFYVTMGTASASLIGLLFVALSLNLDIVTAEAREDLRAYAEQAFNSFSTVLLMAVMFLIPEQGAGVLGVAYVALGLAGAYRMLRRAPVFWRGRKRGGLGEAVFWRFVLPAAATLTLIVSGVAILQNQPAALYWLVWVIIGLLISAARSSWDLLVKVGEEKRGTAGSKPDAVVSPRASAGAGHGAANVEPAASPGAQVPRSD